jgi:uncharacterized membrane protein YccF (DUF307 family)
MKRKVFLRWLLFVAFTANGLVISVLLDYHHRLLEADVTHLSLAIIILSSIISLKLGVDSFSLSTIVEQEVSQKTLGEDDPDPEPIVARIKNNTTIGTHISGLCLAFGMMGTIIGIMLMLQGFDGVNPEDHSSVLRLLNSISSGFATALTTTLVGLICSAILRLQCFNTQYEIRHYRNLVDHGRE